MSVEQTLGRLDFSTFGSPLRTGYNFRRSKKEVERSYMVSKVIKDGSLNRIHEEMGKRKALNVSHWRLGLDAATICGTAAQNTLF